MTTAAGVAMPLVVQLAGKALLHERRPSTSQRDRVLVSKDVGCNGEGFRIRHLELTLEWTQGLEALRLD